MIFKLILSVFTLALGCICFWIAYKARNATSSLRSEVERYKSQYEDAHNAFIALKKKVSEYPEPEGCKSGGWCKACSHSVTVSSGVSLSGYLPTYTSFTACGLGRCDNFEKKERQDES